MHRAEVWWADAGEAKVRPVVLVSRDDAYQRREIVLMVPVTTRVRGVQAEASIGEGEGLVRASVANCDVIGTVSKRMLLRRAGTLGPAKIEQLDHALRFALGLD